MLRKDLLQEGWLEISCKNTSPVRFIMKLFQSFLIPCIILIMHIKKEEPYEMKISRTVLERRFFESKTTVTDVGSIRRKLCGSFTELL